MEATGVIGIDLAKSVIQVHWGMVEAKRLCANG